MASQRGSFIFRIHYLFLLGFIHRFKYYAAWTISEGSCILCGLGYNGYDPKTQKIRWDRVRNIDIWTVETAQNTREMLEAWNMNTNKWLKYSVYLRVTKKGKKPGFRSTLFTFLTSAFWHGTRPGYYLTFATGALYQTCGKIYRRNFRPIFLREDGVTPLPSKKIYDLVGIYAIKLAFGYMVQPFIILDLKPSLMVWGSVYFYVHIIVAFSFFLFRGPYAKQVTEFFKSKQPKEIFIRKQKKLEKDISASSPNLGGILKAKIEHEKGKTAEEEEMNLGIPPIELEKWDNAKEDWEDFCKDYKEWRNKNGLEIEEENLSKAFERFKQEFSNAASGSGERVRKMSFSGYSPKPISKKEE
ncbi:BBT_collapsed_G0051390.mRNA.1.CDS.1 [Saccharomyces cerevisiae]|nr:BBT_collapsed_G0051390.mRNA.1.CDS.1 [Saccharomyces cerevisiae]